ARIASVEANVARRSASETPAAVAISAKPIRSIGFSASSAMKASMMRSRSDLPGRAAGRAAALRADLRADLRALAELLNRSLSGTQGGPARGDVPGAAGECSVKRQAIGSPRQLARALGGGGDGRGDQPFEPALGHQHLERGGGGAAGRGDVLPQGRGVERR